MPDRRPGQDLTGSKEEIEKVEPAPSQPGDARSTYPPDAFARFYNRFPLKEARKKAEAAFLQVRETATIPFPELMAGLERYIQANTPKFRDWCYPATWLNDSRWLSGLPIAVGPPGEAGSSAVRSVFVAADTPQWRAWQDEARRLGKPGWPSHERDGVKGWSFPSAWPPGVDPGTDPLRPGAEG